MPTFRAQPTSSFAQSIRRLMANGGPNLSALDEAQADAAAAQTAQRMSLAEKARANVEATQAAERRRNDPALAAQYAGDVAGIDTPDAQRLYKAVRGVRERPPIEVDDEGNRMPDVTYAKPENMPAGSERLFRSALASLQGNLLATAPTNAEQLAQAGERVNKTALTNQAANTEDIPTANRIVAAAAGRIREPFKLGTQGQVLNEESGEVNEATNLARAAERLSGARTSTEVAKQGELGTRSSRNTAAATLATERAVAVKRGETGRAGQRVTPQQVERWASEVARKEWDVIPARERKGMNYAQHLQKVRERFQSTGTKDPRQDIEEAHDAIARGADPRKVAKRFKERMGFDMPDPPAPIDD